MAALAARGFRRNLGTGKSLSFVRAMRALVVLSFLTLTGCSSEVAPGFAFKLLRQDDCRPSQSDYASAERAKDKTVVRSAWIQGCGPGKFSPSYSIEGTTLVINKGFTELTDGPVLGCACSFEAEWSISHLPSNVATVRFIDWPGEEFPIAKP